MKPSLFLVNPNCIMETLKNVVENYFFVKLETIGSKVLRET